jgi:8-oxo-dGTP diphosphatase
MPNSKTRSRAAGGLVWRRGAQGPEILVVYRERYKDWSLPKGKLDKGEGWTAAALREVKEETGIKARLGPFAGEVVYTYADPKGGSVSKVVRYWHMAVKRDKGFKPNKEIARIAWWSVKKARKKLSHTAETKLIAKARLWPVDALLDED